MKFKSGVDVLGVQPEMVLALVIADSIWRSHKAPELVITSISDGDHMSGSLHYRGLAADLRSNNLDDAMRDGIVEDLVDSLELVGYQVILECAGQDNEHIHIEYDPGTAETPTPA